MIFRLALLTGALVLAAQSAGRIEVVEGNPASPVKVVIYEDLACPDCAKIRTMLDEKLLPKYAKRVAFVHRDLPGRRHEWARPAAIAGLWVFEQSTTYGIVYRRELMAEQEHINAVNLKDWLREFARRYRLDERGIIASLTDPRYVAQLDSEVQGATARGVSKTPSLYLGRQVFVDDILVDDLVRAIDAALEK